jgi:Holliday junction resolvasome RuvABC DNA-binding subunit
VEEDLISALVNLGYQRAAAEQATKRAVERAGASTSFEELFRQSMTLLQR